MGGKKGKEGLFATCTKCFLEKPVEEFPWKDQKRGIRHRVCKECTAKRSNDWYRENKARHIENVMENRRSYLQQAREYAWEYLKTHPCVDCGESNPVVLEFDHNGDKSDAVSRMVTQGRSIELIKKEIAKCEVRCANCHRKKTAKQGGWFRWLTRT